MMHVELHDLIAGPGTGVGNVHAYVEDGVTGQRAPVGDPGVYHPTGQRAPVGGGRGGGCAGLEVRKPEGGVTEAEAEGVERLALEVHVGAAVADVVVHHRRELIDGSGPGDDEVAAGVCVAEEDARQGGAFVLRAVRHVQDGGDVLLRPVDGVRKAGDEQHDG